MPGYHPFTLRCTSLDDENNRVAVIDPAGREASVSYGTGAKGRLLAWGRAEEAAVKHATEWHAALAAEKDERVAERRVKAGTRGDRA